MAAENKNKGGRFINAFKSIQMIGDYEGVEEQIQGVKITEISQKEEDTINSDNAPLDVKANGMDDSLYNGDELYNPLDMEESSDDENKDIQNADLDSSFVKSPSRSLNKSSETSNLNTEFSDLSHNNDSSRELNKTEILENTSINEDVEKISTEDKNEELEVTTSPKKKPDDLKMTFDDDELLGTALAELEQEEKEAELQKIMEKEKESTSSKPKKKKKSKDKEKEKNSKDKDGEKGEKKKKKKKKKRKTKDKTKDKDKDKDKEERSAKKKDKKKKEERKSIQPKENVNIPKERKLEKEVKPEKEKKLEKDRDSKSSKHDKDKRDKSPSKKKDKKRSRDSSKDRKDKEKKSAEHKKDKRSHKHSSKDSMDDDYKHKDKHSRKRSHKEDNLNESSSKRSRKSIDINEKTSDNHDKKSDSFHKKSDSQDKKHSSRQSISEDHNKKHRSRSPSSRNSEKHLSERISRTEHELILPCKEIKPVKELSPPILSKEEFDHIQREARQIEDKQKTHQLSGSENEPDKVLHRSSFSQNFEQELSQFKSEHKRELETSTKKDYNPSKSKSPKEEHYDSHNDHKLSNYTNNDHHHEHYQRKESKRSPSSDIDNLVMAQEEEPEQHSRNNSVDFEMSVNDAIDIDDMYDVAISSQSDDGSVHVVEPKKSLKPGSLSIIEYKERRKGGRRDDARLSSSSQSDTHEDVLKVHSGYNDSVTEVESINHVNIDQNNKADSLDTSLQNGSLYDIGNFDQQEADNDDVLEVKPSIPLLGGDNTKENVKPIITNEVDEDVFENKSPVARESPYNPEESPIDFGSPIPSPGSPSYAAVEDDNVDILAYKDVVAFEDIMKSKVKHEAKKHKRRKLEEMKSEMEGRGATKKEKRLVDYLIRQAQVEEMMKNTLKTYFKSQEITKEEYKSILKKAVPQVTMSNSSIIPEKIESLMTKFVRKCKGQRAKEEKDRNRRKQQRQLAEQQKELQIQLQTNAAMLDSFQPFQQMRALNPNLPLPPM